MAQTPKSENIYQPKIRKWHWATTPTTKDRRLAASAHEMYNLPYKVPGENQELLVSYQRS